MYPVRHGRGATWLVYSSELHAYSGKLDFLAPQPGRFGTANLFYDSAHASGAHWRPACCRAPHGKGTAYLSQEHNEWINRDVKPDH